MSYDITFKVKAEGTDVYIPVGFQDANITWNLRDMIRKATGLEWNNEANNGLVKDVAPAIQKGLDELIAHPDRDKQYESPNGWGTISGCRSFFRRVLNDWYGFQCDCPDLKDVATFWIE